MKPHFKITMLIATLALTLAGCAKKDGVYGERLTDSALGAKAIDSNVTMREGVTADSTGLKFDFTSIESPVNDGQGGVAVRSRFQLNDQQRELVTDHFNPNYGYNTYSAGDATVGSNQLHLTAACSNQSCTMYYVLAEVYSGGIKQLEFGVKYDFSDSGNRWYSIRSKGNFHTNFGSFVQYMNDSSNYH